MQGILDALETALAAGRKVYVHCRAGIGRTGMAVGCRLATQGMGGEKALEHLNQLWRANARSKQWPSVPETQAQREFVRTWGRRPGDSGRYKAGGVTGAATGAAASSGRHRLTTDSGSHPRPGLPVAEEASGPALEATRRVRDRFQGALQGLAAGDALAQATQYRRPGTFAPVGDMLGGGPFNLPRGGWSDDTAMALCLAESLLERNGNDARDQVERYQRWQRQGYLTATGECVGITPAVARALALAGWRRTAQAGSHDPTQLDKEALVRVAPVAMWFFGDAGAAVESAADAARTTHQAPLVLDACRLFCSYVHAALAGRTKQRILAGEPGLWQSRPLKPEVQAIARRIATGEPVPGGRAPGGILEALQVVMHAFSSSRDFRSGALGVVNFGGDSDVVGAAFGQLAGAHYGLAGIPPNWRTALAGQATIEQFADGLLTHALSSLA